MQQDPVHRATFETLEPRRLLSAGDQDLSYGDNGILKFEFGETVYQFLPGSDPLGEATIISMSADQKSFSVRRFDNGIPDEGAGVDGTLATNALPFPVAKTQRVTPDRIWSLSGGRTLLEFDIAGTSPDHESCFIRLNPDFSLDSTYGDGGKRFFSFRFPRLMRQQGDMFVIQSETGGIGRFTDELFVDQSFGTNSVVDLRFPGQLLVQPDGKILAATLSGAPTVKVYRFTEDGQPDTTFGGGDGLAVGGPIGDVLGMALDSQGRIVVSGISGLTRLSPAGLLDETFGQDGRSVPFADFFHGSTFGVVLPDGTMIAPDESKMPGGDAFLRIDEDGTYDQSFGRIAVRLGQFANPHTLSITFDNPQTAQVQLDGSVLVGRRFSNGSYFQVRIAGDGDDPGPVTLSNGVLNVSGTEGDDHIFFGPGNEEPVAALLNNVGRMFPLADVTTFQASGGPGSDVIAVDDFLPLHLYRPAIFSGGDQDDRIFGGDRNDTLSGNAGKDTIFGGLGADRLAGNGGRDRLFGGGGNDRLFGGASGDWLYGQGGNDQLSGEGGSDRLYGDDAGNDTLHGNAGDDILVTRDSLVDHLFGDGGRDTGTADENDVLSSIELVD